MNTGLLIAILVILVIVVVAAVLWGQRRSTDRLQQQFGPEYQRTVARAGDQRSAEADLSGRQQRRRELDIVALEPAVREHVLATLGQEREHAVLGHQMTHQPLRVQQLPVHEFHTLHQKIISAEPAHDGQGDAFTGNREIRDRLGGLAAPQLLRGLLHAHPVLRSNRLVSPLR